MKEITIQISDLDMQILEDGVISPQAWVEGAVAGKVNSVKKRNVKLEIERLVSDPSVTSIPATHEEILEAMFAREGYKNKAERESAVDPSEDSD